MKIIQHISDRFTNQVFVPAGCPTWYYCIDLVILCLHTVQIHAIVCPITGSEQHWYPYLHSSLNPMSVLGCRFNPLIAVAATALVYIAVSNKRKFRKMSLSMSMSVYPTGLPVLISCTSPSFTFMASHKIETDWPACLTPGFQYRPHQYVLRLPCIKHSHPEYYWWPVQRCRFYVLIRWAGHHLIIAGCRASHYWIYIR